LTRAIDRLKINHNIVAENLVLGHDIEMVAIAILICRANIWAPLLVAIVGAQIGYHHNDALAGNSTSAAVGAWWLAGGSQLIAFTAARTAPGSAGSIEECLRAGRCVDSVGNSELDFFSKVSEMLL
jgi:hypothetical protein